MAEGEGRKFAVWRKYDIIRLEGNCHTRSNLGISALLKILQSCKLDHEVGVLRVCEGCLECVWLVSARYREGAWRVQRSVSEKFQNLFEPEIFLDTNNFGFELFTHCFLNAKFLWAQVFWFQYFFAPGNFLIQNFFLNMADQVRAGQVSAGQVRTGQVWTVQVRTSQVRTVQVRTEQVRIEQLRTGHVGTS